MNRRFSHRSALLFASLALFAPLSVVRADSVMTAGAPVAAHFFAPEAIDLAKILPPPPAPDSIAGRADLEAVLQAQAWRTPEQVTWAQLVAKGDMFAVYKTGGAFDAWFTKENLPATAALLKAVMEDMRTTSAAYKKLYPRPRPFLADSRIQPCVERPDSDSYPSGHATVIFIWAGVLTEIFPEKSADISACAHRAIWGRVIGGVHFPTDLMGGRLLAEAALAELKKSPAFHAAVEKCRAEAEPFFLKKAA
jgi:acid phosphatase (class A)